MSMLLFVYILYKSSVNVGSCLAYQTLGGVGGAYIIHYLVVPPGSWRMNNHVISEVTSKLQGQGSHLPLSMNE